MEFIKFPKIKRLMDNMQITVTEKIDGTNGLIMIDGEGTITVGSRNRVISPGKKTDNAGFALWVQDHADELLGLGTGYHYGEWYGGSIQRGYGIEEKRFALFNTHQSKNPNLPACCEIVPVLYEGEYKGLDHIMDLWATLDLCGSEVADYMNPEGLMVFFHFNKTYLKLPMNK